MSELIPRPIALAKLLALGPMCHVELVRVCGWPPEEFHAAAREACRAGLITWDNWRHARWYRAGMTNRRAGTRRRFAEAKKFARDGNNTLRK